jgi:hypothetical protein
MDITVGENYSHRLASGLEIHMFRAPGTAKWKVKSFDVTWGSVAQGSLTTKTWFAERIGLTREFDSKEDACQFVESHVKITNVSAA